MDSERSTIENSASQPQLGDAIVVATFYKFVSLPDYQELRQPLLDACKQRQIMGTILLATEGINSTIAGSRAAIDSFFAYLKSDPRLSDIEHKESISDISPFEKLKVRLKQEIVTLGVPGIDPNRAVGHYVAPQDWNELIADPDVTLIDTRNAYEVEIGTFKGAIDPHTTSFTEFPQYVTDRLDPEKNPKVAMFCTGGIRCEKATSYLLERGFKEVYHLQGGILKYLEEVPIAESQWQGECFVFDDRVSVDNHLNPTGRELCWGCGNPILDGDLESEFYEQGICCPRCHHTITPEIRHRRSQRLQHRQRLADS
jgi:UPF0176 protein